MADIFDGWRAYGSEDSTELVRYVGHDSARGVHVFESSVPGARYFVDDAAPVQETDDERVVRRAVTEAAGIAWTGSVTHRITTSPLEDFLACCFVVPE